MKKNRIMVIGEKESFLIRVLLKKLNDTGTESAFTPMDVDKINALWETSSLLVCYLDSGDNLPEKVIRFLIDKMTDDEKQMIAIGEPSDTQQIVDRMPGELIYKVFARPLDNEAFLHTVNEYFHKVEAGEFRKSILIVDDDPNYLGLVREWLKSKYKVAMVTSGLQAIKWLGKNKADLILLDYEMPVTSGPQVLEMLRSDAETSSIPVIFLTGKSERDSVMKVVALKPEGYFLKDIKKAELLEKLENFFILHK
ncbi:MAG: response regulator [Lachnospiraceae bacterium]|nr:response regulator [Lachnospiraceae bacterium]